MEHPGLYIHVPFCKSKCGYCDFYSVTGLNDIPEYIKALLEEISIYSNENWHFDSVYIGGGTPSLLDPADIAKILTRLRKNFPIAADAEITLEANPADIHGLFLTSLRQAGINRLNLGIQSFDDCMLHFLGRRHTAIQAIESIRQARTVGFDNIGLDLIFGIPGQTLEAWQNTLYEALALLPEHLSCYQLNLENHTPLGQRHGQNEFSLPNEEQQYVFLAATADILEDAGYVQYEISSFARDGGYKSRHNGKYWRHIPYLGLGPAAHSFSGSRRWWNHASLKSYLSDLGAGRRPVAGEELLTAAEYKLETRFLALRTREWAPLGIIMERHEGADDGPKNEIMDELEKQGFIVVRDGYFQPTRRGLAVADRLALIL
jgi:oxygen-independent coproporphyrinogen-3 oxidase